MKKMSFSIEHYELEEINNSQFSKLKLYVCHDLDNKNGSYISFESMKQAESTLWNKPIIMKLNKFGTDFEEHETDVIIVGMIPQIGSNIHYEEISGRNYLVADAIIWKYYSSATLEIFERDKTKGISMEVQVLEEHEREEDGLTQLDNYTYLAVCLLGNSYETGMYRTTAQMVGFSKDNTVDYLNKEWSLFMKNELKIQKVSSSDRLNTRKSKDTKISKNDLDVKVSKSSKKENLTKEVKEVEMPMDNEKKEVIDHMETEQDKLFVDVTDEKVDAKEEMANTEEMAKADDESKEEVKDDAKEEKTETPDEEGKEEKSEKEDMAKSDEEVKDDAKETMSAEEMSVKYAELKSSFEALTEKMSEKDTAMLSLNAELMSIQEESTKYKAEFEALKTYKESIEKSEKFDKLKDTFSALVNVLSKEEIDEWKVKSEKCEDISVFEREIKSFACDKILKLKGETGVTKFSNMAVNLDANDECESEDDNVWNRITKRVSK